MLSLTAKCPGCFMGEDKILRRKLNLAWVTRWIFMWGVEVVSSSQMCFDGGNKTHFYDTCPPLQVRRMELTVCRKFVRADPACEGQSQAVSEAKIFRGHQFRGRCLRGYYLWGHHFWGSQLRGHQLRDQHPRGHQLGGDHCTTWFWSLRACCLSQEPVSRQVLSGSGERGTAFCTRSALPPPGSSRCVLLGSLWWRTADRLQNNTPFHLLFCQKHPIPCWSRKGGWNQMIWVWILIFCLETSTWTCFLSARATRSCTQKQQYRCQDLKNTIKYTEETWPGFCKRCLCTFSGIGGKGFLGAGFFILNILLWKFSGIQKSWNKLMVNTLNSIVNIGYTHLLTSLPSIHPQACAVLFLTQSDLQTSRPFTLNTSLWVTLESNICLLLFCFVLLKYFTYFLSIYICFFF